MGGQGSGRPPSVETLIKREYEPKTPIVRNPEVFLPNYSGRGIKFITAIIIEV